MTFTYEKVVNIYFVYKVNLWSYTKSANFTLENSLFGAAKVTKNADTDKYSYSGYGIWLYTGKNILLSVDSGIGKGPEDSSDDTMLTA